MRRIILPLLALATVAGSAAASPLHPIAPARAFVYSDLDLQDPDGAAAMLHRIRVAAASVCHIPAATRFEEIQESQRCQAESVARAVRKLNARLVTLAYEAQGPSLAMARLD